MTLSSASLLFLCLFPVLFSPNRSLEMCWSFRRCANGWHLRNITFSHSSSSPSLFVNLSAPFLLFFYILICCHTPQSVTCGFSPRMSLFLTFFSFLLLLYLIVSSILVFLWIHKWKDSKQSEAELKTRLPHLVMSLESSLLKVHCLHGDRGKVAGMLLPSVFERLG